VAIARERRQPVTAIDTDELRRRLDGLGVPL
jgi:hypothetical protein